PKAATDLHRSGGPAAWLRAFRSLPRKPHHATLTLNMLAMTACYSPAPRKELGFELPFDPATGELIDRVWRRWLTQDPVRMLPKHARALKGLRLLFLDAGLRDEWNLHLGARIFSRRARALGVKHLHAEFDDGHMDISYRYDVSLPLVAKAIA
ncbi:MAG TPA: hypothetical protein VLV15_09260, partial [Dongiaceae bacterium]|nr:hypothetical protein [Dongiaceae bacterium]